MKMIFAAIALTISAPVAAQTADPHAAHSASEHAAHKAAEHAAHQGHGADHDKACDHKQMDCCKDADGDGKMECCEKADEAACAKMHSGQAAGHGGHAGHSMKH